MLLRRRASAIVPDSVPTLRLAGLLQGKQRSCLPVSKPLIVKGLHKHRHLSATLRIRTKNDS